MRSKSRKEQPAKQQKQKRARRFFSSSVFMMCFCIPAMLLHLLQHCCRTPSEGRVLMYAWEKGQASSAVHDFATCVYAHYRHKHHRNCTVCIPLTPLRCWTPWVRSQFKNSSRLPVPSYLLWCLSPHSADDSMMFTRKFLFVVASFIITNKLIQTSVLSMARRHATGMTVARRIYQFDSGHCTSRNVFMLRKVLMMMMLSG